MAKTLLIHHSANRGHAHPPNSLRSLRFCLEAGARVVEVDITPLSGGDFALLHDGQLDTATDGRGPTFAAAVTTLKQEQPGPWRGAPADVAAVLAGGFAPN